MSIDDNGFFDPDIEEFAHATQIQHRPVFDICFAVNRLAQHLKFDFKGRLDDPQQILAICLFIRILNGFQASIIASKYGLNVEARVIARTVLEAYFYLKQLCENEAFAQKFFEDSEARRLGHINYILNQRPDLLTPELRLSLEKEKADISSRGISRASELSLPQIMGDLYAAYRTLSDEVHPTAWSAEQYVQCQGDSETMLIAWGPSTAELEPTLVLVCEIVVQSLKHMCTLFGVDATTDLLNIDATLDPLRTNLDGYYRI